ncbi:MAG TPA: DUF4349 domain-containing protein [Trebonia sp.]
MRSKRAIAPRSSRRRLAGLAGTGFLILLIAATASCSGSESSSSAAAMAAAPAAASPSAAAAGSLAGNGPASSGTGARTGTTVKYASGGQQLIYTAQLTVRAPDVRSALTRATSVVSAAGGYVSGENAASGQGQPSQATASATFKIPVAVYATTLAALSGNGLGTQLSLSQQAQDVTQQVADTDSRVASDEVAISQLRTLLKQAGSVGSLLSVQNQIDSEESGLESMLAQQSALDHETAYATVSLTLVGPKAAAKPPAKSAPPPGLTNGLSGGWHALGVTVSWLLAIIGAVAPFAAPVAVIVALIWWGRRRLARRPGKPAA